MKQLYLTLKYLKVKKKAEAPTHNSFNFLKHLIMQNLHWFNVAPLYGNLYQPILTNSFIQHSQRGTLL